MVALVEVVDHVPVINLRNCVTVSKVPLDVVTQGLGGKLRDAAQIPFGFGTRAGCLVVLYEGGVEVPLMMTVVDAGSKIAAVKAGAKIRQVDLLIVAMGAYRAV